MGLAMSRAKKDWRAAHFLWINFDKIRSIYGSPQEPESVNSRRRVYPESERI
jgi:hypothetical protein